MSVYTLGQFSNFGQLGSTLMSDDEVVGIENLSDDQIAGLCETIGELGASRSAKNKAYKKVISATSNKSKNINRETGNLTDKALFEQRLNQLPADVRQKLESGKLQLVPHVLYGVKPIGGVNHVDMFESGDNTVKGVTNVVQGRMPAEDYMLVTGVRIYSKTYDVSGVDSSYASASEEKKMQEAAWDNEHMLPQIYNGEFMMGQESTTYIDKTASTVFFHKNLTTMPEGYYKLQTPKMFYPQRTINVEFDFVGAVPANSYLRVELLGVKTTKA